MFPLQFANIFLTYQTSVANLHLLRVELRCKLQEKLPRVTGPLGVILCHLYSVIFNLHWQCILGKCTCRYLFRDHRL